MARTRDTDPDGDEYDPADAADLADWLEAQGASMGGGGSHSIEVEAQVEWAGTIDNNGRGGVRRTRLDGLDLSGVRDALAGRSADRTSYTAKGWQAQLRKLYDTPGGSRAADRAGLNPSAATARRWLSGQAPSRANQERIARAYGELRTRPRRGSDRAVADALTRATRDRYGVNVRFRGIESLRVTR